MSKQENSPPTGDATRVRPAPTADETVVRPRPNISPSGPPGNADPQKADESTVLMPKQTTGDEQTRLASPRPKPRPQEKGAEPTSSTTAYAKPKIKEDATRVQSSSARANIPINPHLNNEPPTASPTATDYKKYEGPFREVDVGSTIRGRFVLKKVLGRGGMGAVYQALDLIKQEARDTNPYIAIKLLNGDFKEHPQAFVSLQREAKKTQELAHPNIVTCYDFDREDGVIYLTMEQLSGASLYDVIRGKTDIVLNNKEKLDVIRQIAKGLAYAHKKGIVHSDLKPANIFYTKEGVIKILDFGIARAANTELYQDNFDAGDLGALTLNYSSPQMIRFEAPHPSDDIYALGIIICELLNDGKHPFNRKDARTAIETHLHPKLPKINNPLLRKLVLSTLDFERSKRISDANVFLKKFNNAILGPKRIALITCIAILALVVNVFYIQTIETNRVPFSSLPKESQTLFHQLIDEGNTALRFNDLQGAVVSFNAAYLIHNDNKNINKAKKKVSDIYQKKLQTADSNSKAFAEAEIIELKKYPAFTDILGEK